MNRLIVQVSHYYNTSLNIPSLFPVGIIISSTGFAFTILSSFDSATVSAVLFPINPPAASAAFWPIFLEAVFKVSSLVSNNCFLYLLEGSLANDKNTYPLTFFLVPSLTYFQC